MTPPRRLHPDFDTIPQAHVAPILRHAMPRRGGVALPEAIGFVCAPVQAPALPEFPEQTHHPIGAIPVTCADCGQVDIRAAWAKYCQACAKVRAKRSQDAYNAKIRGTP